MNTFISFSKKPLIIASAALVIAIFAIGILAKKNQRPDILNVAKATIREEVLVTGKTKPTDDIELAFEKTGKIVLVKAFLGDTVKKNDIIAVLDQTGLLADLEEALATIEQQKAKLSELKNGSRSEEIQIEEAKVKNAELLSKNSKLVLVNDINDSFTKSDDAVRNKIDALFSNAQTFPQLVISTTNQLKINSESQRSGVENVLNKWLINLSTLTLNDNLSLYSETALVNLNTIKSFLDTMALIVNNALTSTTLAQSTLDSYKNNVSTARANVNTAIVNLTSGIQNWESAGNDYDLAQKELNLKISGPTQEQLEAQEALVKQAEAKQKSIRAELSKTIIRAPINGLITRQNAKLGEIATQNSTLVTMHGSGPLEIETDVPEVDIIKLAIGNTVKITVDAIPGEIFSGKIIKIDPAETIVDGVVNFKTTIAFDAPNQKVKSGLTVSLEIITNEKTDALVLPQYAILENDEGTFARKITNGKIAEVPVVIGIRDQEGMVEIVSGLEEHDQVINIGFKTSQAQ